MNFWERVDALREYKGMTRKELSRAAGFSLNSISTGIARGSVPSADVALKIAKSLGVTVEFLFANRKGDGASPLEARIADDWSRLADFRDLLDKYAALPEREQIAVTALVESLHQSAPPAK